MSTRRPSCVSRLTKRLEGTAICSYGPGLARVGRVVGMMDEDDSSGLEGNGGGGGDEEDAGRGGGGGGAGALALQRVVGICTSEGKTVCRSDELVVGFVEAAPMV